MKEIFSRSNLPRLILMLVTAIGIIATSIIFKQSFWRVLPLFVSLFIALLQSRVNRYAPLIGGINSVLYAVVYFSLGLYFNAFYALLFSFPLQILTFIRWGKNKRGSTTMLRRMKGWQRLVVLAGFVAVSFLAVSVLKLIGSDYALLDTVTSLLGILVSFLTLYAFVEYTVLQLASGLMSILLNAVMVMEGQLFQTPYLIFSFYSMICLTIAVPTAIRLYASQKPDRAAAPAVTAPATVPVGVKVRAKAKENVPATAKGRV